MRQSPSVGRNRTGVGAAPDRARQMVDGMSDFPPSSHGNGDGAAEVRIDYAESGMPLGSIPATGAGGAKVDPALAPLADKLGARLAFERVGTRLYDALLSKQAAYGGFDGGPTREDLEVLRSEEHEHMLLLQRTITDLGADPTAVTPSANLQLAIGMGIPAVVTDPRASLLESLEAALVAELADQVSWEALIELAESQGLDEFVRQAKGALATEAEHLEKVRRWLAAGEGRTA